MSIDFDAPLLPEAPVIPDSIEPYLGYKALNVFEAGLASPSYHCFWPVGSRLEARCTTGVSQWSWVPKEGEPRSMEEQTYEFGGTRFMTVSSSSARVGTYRTPTKPNNPLPPGWNWSWEPLTHDSPAEDCHCGIYVAKKPEKCLQYLGASGVIAEIALWGKVIPAHDGARGQYAYPQKILTPKALMRHVEPVALLYGLKIDVLDLAEKAGLDEQARLVDTVHKAHLELLSRTLRKRLKP